MKSERFTIRTAIAADAKAVLEAHYAAVHGTAAKDYSRDILDEWAQPMTKERIEKYSKNLERGDETTLVAEVDGQIVGFTSIVEPLGELRAVYVHSHFGRMGVGSKLLSAIEEIARGKGIFELHTDSSLTASRFYSRHGYMTESHGIHRLQSGKDMECVVMRKRL